MFIGVPKEIKNSEHRVALTPESVNQLRKAGHQVIIETNAGLGINKSDIEYKNAGALIAQNAASVWEKAELIVKVKEPQKSEIPFIRQKHIIFTYLHLAADIELAISLKNTGCTAIAYETITDHFGKLPLLQPMSLVAGKLAPQVGANLLEKRNGGSGVLLGGVPGVAAGKVTIIGAGTSGYAATQIAVGFGANVSVIDENTAALSDIDKKFGNRVRTYMSNEANIAKQVEKSDLVIGAVLVAGMSTPKLISNELISNMKRGSVIVDIAIDQGGIFEGAKPTTHQEPVIKIGNVLAYCVANMPGMVPETSTYALNNVTIPYIEQIASLGWREFAKRSEHNANGIAISNGEIIHNALRREMGLAS